MQCESLLQIDEDISALCVRQHCKPRRCIAYNVHYTQRTAEHQPCLRWRRTEGGAKGLQEGAIGEPSKATKHECQPV